MNNDTITITVIHQEKVVGVVGNMLGGVILTWDMWNGTCLRTYRWEGTMENFHSISKDKPQSVPIHGVTLKADPITVSIKAR